MATQNHKALLDGRRNAPELFSGRVVAAASVLGPSVQAQLAAQGFLVERVGDNREALALLKPHAAGVVLAALRDPRLSGIELCRLIKQQRLFANVSVILVTERQSAEDFLVGLNAGAAFVIARPFSAAFCVSRIRAAALQLEPEVFSRSDRAEPEGCGRASGIQVEYLHPPSGIPSALQQAVDRASDALFLTKLAARHHLRKLKGLFTG